MAAPVPTTQGLSTIAGHIIDNKANIGIVDIPNKGPVVFQSPDAARIVPSRHQMYLINPYSGINNGGTNSFTGQTVQFRIQPNLITGRIRHAQLEFTLNETSGINSVTPASVPFLFQQLYCSLNGQSQNKDQILYGGNANQFYHNLQYKSRQQLQNLNGGSMNLMNMNIDTFQGESAIPPGGTALQVLNLESTLLVKITPNTLSNDFWLSVILPNSTPAIAGLGTLSLGSMNLRIWSEANDLTAPVVKGAMDRTISTINFLHNYLQVFTQTLTAATPATLPLTGVAGAKAATMLIFIQSGDPQSYVGANIRNYVSLGGTLGDASPVSPGTIDLQIAAGTSVLGGGALSPSYFLRASTPALSDIPGNMSSVIPYYAIYFGDNNGEWYQEDGPGFYRTANYQGGYCPQNSDKLIVTPSSSFTTGTYTISVLLMSQASCDQFQGQFKIISK